MPVQSGANWVRHALVSLSLCVCSYSQPGGGKWRGLYEAMGRCVKQWTLGA
jgi:hypothetical protein